LSLAASAEETPCHLGPLATACPGRLGSVRAMVNLGMPVTLSAMSCAMLCCAKRYVVVCW